ncbi:MAG TPA: BTAD domain-containing putative transcriptional regulator [Microlunatus sp.]|nr:BTAD domain-containing putative transcriptional regulator [Microlunatus sp.]
MNDPRNMMDPVIFLEKVRRPVLRGLVRDRLDRRLAEQIGPDQVCSCVLVLAPPGSGKTTLLCQFAEATGTPIAWYRAGAEDVDELALTRHLGYAIGSALSDPEVIAAAASGRIADLVRRLDRPDIGGVQLVVDDLHEIARTPAEGALETFLRLRPRTITVALGSRRQPGLNTSRLLVSGELIMVDGEDLRFRSWEVEQLFRAVYGAPLSPEAAAALTRRTGGWAAGLQLFHLATAQLGRVDRERAATDLSGRSRLIRSYLARNVLEGLPAERRRFLLHTSALGVLTGDLCDELLETQGSAAVLAELEREQFFTTSSDGGLTYHYHQVLQTHLEVLVTDELGSRAARELYARSGSLLERTGRPVEAVRAHARAEDWGAVARLMRPGTAFVDGDDTLWRLLSLPGAPTDDPGLVLAGARRLARDGQVQPALAAYREAERLLDDPGFGRRCAAERQAVGVWLPQSPTTALPPSPPGADPESALLRLSIELRRLTRDVRRPESYEQGWRRGLAYALGGDLESAERELAVVWTPGPTAPGWESLAADLVDCLAQAISAPDDSLVGRIETITLGAEMDGWPWLARLGRGLQTIVQLHDGSGWRVEAAFDLLAGLGRVGDRWSHLVAAVGIAVSAYRARALPLAVEARRQAVDLADALGAPALVGAIDRLAGPRDGGVAARSPDLIMIMDGSSDSGAAATTTMASRRKFPDRRQPRIELTCLGGFGLRVGGREVGWRALRPKARSLLMLLALHHGRPRHRELIIETLWPEATLTSGIRSLQVAVSSVRHCLATGGVPEESIPRQGDAYELVLPGVQSDLVDFERLAEEARRQPAAEALSARSKAMDLYQGELLPEVGPADWVVEERERLRLLAATVASAAASDAVTTGDLGRAIDLARRSIALDPFHDPAWERLIDTYENLGDRSAAAIARGDHQRVWDDLGLVVPATRRVPA